MNRLKAEPTYYLIVTVFRFGIALWGTLSTLYRFQDASLSPLQLVLVGTALEVAYFLFEVPTGVVADVVSRRLSVIIAYALMGLGFFVEGLFPLFGPILLAQVLWGTGATFESGALSAWLADEIGETKLQAVFLRGSQFGRVATLLGIICATLLARAHTLALPMQIGGLIVIGLAALLVFVMPETGFKPLPRAEHEGWGAMGRTLRAGLANVRGNRILLIALLLSVIIGLSSEGRDRLWEAHLLTNFSFPVVFGRTLDIAVWFGAIHVVTLLLGFAVTEYVRRAVDLETQQQALRAQIVLTGVEVGSMVLFAWVGGLGWALGSWLLHRSAGGVRYPIWDAWLNKEAEPRTRATLLSLVGQMNALGQIVGGPPLGVVGNLLGLRWAMFVVALLLAPAIWLYSRAMRLTQMRISAAVDS